MLSALLLALPFFQSGPTRDDLADLTPRWEAALAEFQGLGLAVVVVEGGEIVHRVTLGRRDPGREAPVTGETIFYIASATKPFVAFALAQLAERGKVELDAPVQRYLPRFRLADEELAARITVRDLLCHRPGLNSFGAVALDAYTGEITEERYWHFLAQERGGAPEYSNVHFTLAGRVVEAVSGLSWRDWLAREVFAPAGMTRSSGYADWMYAQDDVAWPSVVEGGTLVRAPLVKSDRTMHAAGGLGLSIDDCARWLALQLGRGEIDGKRLLGASATEATWKLEQALPDGTEFGASEGFGLGWQRGNYRGHVELRHGGGYTGAASYLCFLPELELGFAFLASGDFGAQALLRVVSSDVHERLLADDEERDLLPVMRERLLSERKRQRAAEEEERARPLRALELSVPRERCTGTFTHEWFGTLVVASEGEGLAARLGDLPLRVRGKERDLFELTSLGSVDTSARLVIADGAVVAYELDLDGPVVFAR